MTRIFQKVMFFPNRFLFKLIIKKNIYFNPNLKPFQCFNKTSKSTFSEKYRYALYPLYANLVTYVLALGGEQCQFLCRVIFDDSAQTWLYLFLLILQTAKRSTKKRKLSCCPPDFFYVFFSVQLMSQWLPH